MRFRPHELFPSILVTALALFVLSGVTYAQPSVTISVPTPSSTPFQSPKSLTVTANVTGTNIEGVFFYRNDVLVGVDKTYPYELPQTLYQDTYKYRATAVGDGGVGESVLKHVRS